MLVELIILMLRFEYFLCIPDAGNLEKLANEFALASNEVETEAQEWQDRFVGLVAGVEVASTHQRLLMVLSNVGFCHSTLLPEQTRKHEHVWTYQGYVSKTNAIDRSIVEDIIQNITGIRVVLLDH
jgi:hypothetical protein